MSDKQRFQLTNICWICDKLFDVGDAKVSDNCHITGKYIILPYNDLIIKDISKFNEKVTVIRNGLEKCMAFTINRHFAFIDSMRFMNSSLDALVKNLSGNDFNPLCHNVEKWPSIL